MIQTLRKVYDNGDNTTNTFSHDSVGGGGGYGVIPIYELIGQIIHKT